MQQLAADPQVSAGSGLCAAAGLACSTRKPVRRRGPGGEIETALFMMVVTPRATAMISAAPMKSPAPGPGFSRHGSPRQFGGDAYRRLSGTPGDGTQILCGPFIGRPHLPEGDLHPFVQRADLNAKCNFEIRNGVVPGPMHFKRLPAGRIGHPPRRVMHVRSSRPILDQEFSHSHGRWPVRLRGS